MRSLHEGDADLQEPDADDCCAMWRSGVGNKSDRAVWLSLGLGWKQGRIGHDNDAPHDGMDATLIGISARRQARDRIGASGFHGAGIKGASAALFKASIVGDGMVGWSRIVPSHCRTSGHGDCGRHIVG